MTNQQNKVKEITLTGVMAALIFTFTYTFKIPLGTGYAHLGDAIIFLSIGILGSRRASLASALGAALADLIGGYVAWVFPTLLIKLLMVILAGVIIEKVPQKLLGFVVGTVSGGVFQIGAYTLAKLIIYDKAYALTTLPELILQTSFGVGAAVVLLTVFEKTGVMKKLSGLAE